MFLPTAGMVPFFATLLAGLRWAPSAVPPSPTLGGQGEVIDAADDTSLMGYTDGRHPGRGNPVPAPFRPRPVF